MPLPYALLRPALFALDPESAHEHMMDSLARLQHSPLACAWGNPQVSDPIRLAGMQLPNRVGLAAGLDKNARCIDAFARMGFGLVEVGTVTPLPQPGNPKPRMFRLPEHDALINRLGFNNDGLQAFVRNVTAARCRQPGASGAGAAMRLGLNIGKNAITPIENATSDYLLGLEGVYAYADYVTVNISSPNTKNLRELQSDEALDALLAALMTRRAELAAQHGREVPLFVKIAPDLDAAQIAVIAATLKRHGCDAAGQPTDRLGVIATNTTLNREAIAGHRHAEEAGGLSGKPVFALSNAVIAQLRAALGAGFPIIGAGGVASGEDAVAKLRAGADAVQIYTGLIYQGPALVHEAAQAIAKAFKR
jgi:dihydroorotate dehydrogenase